VIRGYVFDAYGTLFDVHSVVEAGREITSDPVALSIMWRQKQLSTPGCARSWAPTPTSGR
jgi:FMN phosphatase YigB (HAD superfamily)